MHRSNRIGFWIVLLLIALGGGWVANQQWPFLQLFAPEAEQEQATAVEQPAEEPAQAPVASTEDAADTAEEVAAAQPDAPLPEPAAGPEPEPSAEAAAEAETQASEAEVAEESSPDTASPGTDAQVADSQPSVTPLIINPPAEASVAGTTEDTATGGEAQVADTPVEDSEPAAVETATSAEDSSAPGGSQPTEAPETEVAALTQQDDPDQGEETARPEAASVTPPAELEQPETGEADTQAPDTQASDTQAANTEAAEAPALDEDVAALLSDAKTGTPPSFDVVRVQPDGRAVIAGRAEPGSEVELRSGDEVIDRVRASGRGDWVAIPGKPLDPGDQQLTLVSAQPGAPAIESQQMVVVAVPEPAPSASPVVSQPMAVVLPRDGGGTGRILQAPGRLSAEGTLALMTVNYDELGQMLLSGEAPPGAPVRIYLDNRPVAVAVGDANGNWSAELDEALDPGTYTLRLDQLGADGQTVARIETPITRVSEPPIEGELQVDYVVVQPGNSLWRIARRLSGRGIDYVYIYDSNQGQIRDPNLIFPGQVFQVPPELDSAG